jgi:hypothetical protein
MLKIILKKHIIYSYFFNSSQVVSVIMGQYEQQIIL